MHMKTQPALQRAWDHTQFLQFAGNPDLAGHWGTAGTRMLPSRGFCADLQHRLLPTPLNPPAPTPQLPREHWTQSQARQMPQEWAGQMTGKDIDGSHLLSAEALHCLTSQ